MLHADLLGERARLTPQREALVEVATGSRWTYAELNRWALQTAVFLRHTLGLPVGARVAALLTNSAEFLYLYFAAAKASLVLVPLNPKLAVPELVRILRHAEPALLICHQLTAAQAQPAAQAAGIPKLLCWDAPGEEGLVQQVARSPALPLPPPEPEQVLAILYTSGTTGEPKGVMIPHRMVAFDAWATVLAWQLRADDISPIYTPLYHAGGLSAFLTPILSIGGTIILHRAFDAEEVLRTFTRERCTVALGVPTLWRLLADHPLFDQVDLSSVRWCISGGAPLPVSLIERYRQRGLVLRQGYGLTEVGVNCFAMNDQDAWRKAGSIGKPFPFTAAKVVGEDGHPLGPGEVGELCLKGPHVCLGYFRNPEATAQAFDGEGFFRTGDLAYYDEEGYFFIAGRRKEMFISGGINIFPAEVESVLVEHPQVADAAVVGVPDEVWGEKGVAFVVLRPGAALAAEELVQFLRGRLANFKIPKEFLFVQELPRTAYGKVVRRQLLELWQRRQP
ncbi:MAG: AMP-binding protein [Thermoanaerobaculum sp.]|nr:AMP-binding protein [Thermoanaerobaculum sp.]